MPAEKPFFQVQEVEEKLGISAQVPASVAKMLAAYEAYTRVEKSVIVAGMLKRCFAADTKFVEAYEAGTIKIKDRKKPAKAKAAGR